MTIYRGLHLLLAIVVILAGYAVGGLRSGLIGTIGFVLGWLYRRRRDHAWPWSF